MNEQHLFYRDKRFEVSSADVKTPTMIYPIGESVIGRVRKDIQVGGLGLGALIGSALAIYWDLWFWSERIAMFALIVLAILIAASFSILQIEARGYPPRLFIARRKVIRRIFDAIAKARASHTLVFTGSVLEQDLE
ncbi:MAG: hypothetical protein MRY64_14805 [Hyphomonadaceae bacterium]|nr:hypothetical protein [Hyphomonadaceae bacterium]